MILKSTGVKKDEDEGTHFRNILGYFLILAKVLHCYKMKRKQNKMTVDKQSKKDCIKVKLTQRHGS